MLLTIGVLECERTISQEFIDDIKSCKVKIQVWHLYCIIAIPKGQLHLFELVCTMEVPDYY